MKKSLLLALAFVAVAGYVMAEEDTTATTPKDETTQTAPVAPVAPAESQEDESLDMDAMLDETEEAK
ncbi:MAG: hypothetical protein V1646_01330 [bacterium]|mgnify:FL=1|jgi:hypothetical protein